jgi:hypothetical protein
MQIARRSHCVPTVPRCLARFVCVVTVVHIAAPPTTYHAEFGGGPRGLGVGSGGDCGRLNPTAWLLLCPVPQQSRPGFPTREYPPRIQHGAVRFRWVSRFSSNVGVTGITVGLFTAPSSPDCIASVRTAHHSSYQCRCNGHTGMSVLLC